MKGAPRNIGASVRAKLLRLAAERREDFQLLLTRYANERFLYRLAASAHGTRFVLKGAALFTVWLGSPHRATRDVDLLGFGQPTEEHVRTVLEDVFATVVAADGVVFDAPSLVVGPIREDQEYGGIRATVTARITSAQVRLQIDIGFGDAITPGAEIVDFPVLLDFEAPKLCAYPRESVVAEKLEAMVQLGMANSRMKDFFDIAVLSRLFDFDGELLARAIRATFTRRGTGLPSELPIALTPTFANDPTKNIQWKAFLRKSGAVEDPDGGLAAAIRAIVTFAAKPLAAAADASPWRARWPAGGPWSA